MPHALLSKTEYSLMPIEKENWRKLDASPNAAIAFVDGGNSLLLQTPTAELHKIRGAIAVVVDKKLAKAVQKEGLLIAKAIVENGEIKYEATLTESSFGNKIEHLQFPEVANHERPLGKMAELCRKQCELHLAREAIRELDGDKYIVLDGTLEAVTEREKEELKALANAAAANNAILGSVAKTCSLLADSGESVISAVEKISPEEGYALIAEGKGERHRAAIAIARLNSSSKHLFRIEAANEKEIMQLANALLPQANDLAFPGYPYGLVMADRLARVGKSETELIQAKILATAKGETLEMLRNRKAMDAHTIIDGM